ncbi:MAG: aspartate-semialdehyde dehydrogenase [Patescibacteria group bacterium]
MAVVGATGIVGQQLLVYLEKHPWFRVARLAASQRSAGKSLADALQDKNGALRWWASSDPPAEYLDLVVEDAAELNPGSVQLVFSAVEAEAARELEPLYAREVPVVSTASAFRSEPDTPILVGGVNMDHAKLLLTQQKKRGWKGFVAPKPNCTTAGLVVSLKPILDRFGLKTVVVTSMQALSGAGRTPGVIGLDVIDNLLPYIPGEEEKTESESRKILGALRGEEIVPATFTVSATCTRVPVLDGHTVVVYAETECACPLDEAARAMREFGRGCPELGLPSAPQEFIHLTGDPFRPQPRIDRERGGGMTATVGRLRRDPAWQNGLRYVCLSHNTKFGAAKGSLLTAEYLVKEFLKWV